MPKRPPPAGGTDIVSVIITFLVVGGFCLIAVFLYSLLPDREISDDQYIAIARSVEQCPAAQTALDVAAKDHKILSSEASTLNAIIADYVEQDERKTKAHDVAVAKGLIKGPLIKRSCLPLEPMTQPKLKNS